MKTRKLAALLLTIALLLTALAGCGGSAAPSTETSQPAADSAAPADTGAAQESQPAPEPVELYISAAASLTDVMAQIADAYKAENPNVTLTITFDSSGTLQTQIEEGAPADVFVSANTKQMNALNDEGLVQADTMINLLQNKGGLIVPKDSTLGLTSFEDAALDKVEIVGVGDSNVPAGQYAQQVFESLGLWDKISAKGNFGNTVRAVLTWVETGDVDCGVVYATDAATTDAVTVICEAPAGSCKDIIYPAAVLANAEHPAEAADFVTYLTSDTSAALFEAAGFTMYQ
jgi:molybdate transport system substrate-binding protein